MFLQRDVQAVILYLKGHTSLVTQKLKDGTVKWGGVAVGMGKAGIDALNAGKNFIGGYLKFWKDSNLYLQTSIRNYMRNLFRFWVFPKGFLTGRKGTYNRAP